MSKPCLVGVSGQGVTAEGDKGASEGLIIFYSLTRIMVTWVFGLVILCFMFSSVYTL